VRTRLFRVSYSQEMTGQAGVVNLRGDGGIMNPRVVPPVNGIPQIHGGRLIVEKRLWIIREYPEFPFQFNPFEGEYMQDLYAPCQGPDC